MGLMKIFIGLLFINFTIQASNTEDTQCAGNIPQSSIHAQVGGLYKPSLNGANEYMKVLVVFVQFDSTDVDVNNTTWPKDQLPTWANSLIASSPSNSYPDMTISDYWKDMSMGSFDFIGDVYPNLVTINTEDYYKNNGYHFGECNKDALTQINPYVDFSDYDNWSFNSSTQSFEFTPDGYVDMIIMIYRTPDNAGGWFDDGKGDFNAIALLSGSSNTYTLNFDGVNILGKRNLEVHGSGLTVKKGIKSLADTLPILAHEYGHYLFGYNHSNTGGIMSDPPSYSLSAVERERLAYIAYTNCTQNNFTLTLEDFITNGDVLRIPIPITNPNSTTFFLVENHQKLSKYDQIIRGGSIGGGYDYTDTGSGIYVWLVKNGNSSIKNVYYEAVTADGRWNWAYDGDYYAGPGWYTGKPWEGYVPKTKRVSVNRNTGKTDKKEEHIYWNNHNASKWVDNRNGYYELTRNVMGDEYDAFNFGYNELFTPWSNPSTYVNGNTNISVKLYYKNGNNITVKIFTTYNSSLNLPPSKPQNLQVHSLYDHPKLTWDANTEPDLNGYWIYRRENNGSFHKIATVSSSATSYIDYSIEFTKPIWGTWEEYDYKIKAIDTQNKLSVYSNSDHIAGYVGDLYKKMQQKEELSIKEYRLKQNYPNPFNPTTTITYQLPKASYVKVSVFDILGKQIAVLVNEKKEAGTYDIKFDASSLPSGLYLYKLQTDGFTKVHKMLLMK